MTELKLALYFELKWALYYAFIFLCYLFLREKRF